MPFRVGKKIIGYLIARIVLTDTDPYFPLSTLVVGQFGTNRFFAPGKHLKRIRAAVCCNAFTTASPVLQSWRRLSPSSFAPSTFLVRYPARGNKGPKIKSPICPWFARRAGCPPPPANTSPVWRFGSSRRYISGFFGVLTVRGTCPAERIRTLISNASLPVDFVVVNSHKPGKNFDILLIRESFPVFPR